VKVNWPKVQKFKNGVVKKLTGGAASLLKGNKVEFFSGEVMFINENEARVFNDQEATRYRFKNCIIATGSRPIELKAFAFSGRSSSLRKHYPCLRFRRASLLSVAVIPA
jgi:dihydrolipoamide dehydrogenase